MTLTVKAAALSGFVQTLKALDAILDKAVDQAETRKIQPEVLLSARLAPDMLAFTRQIQLCCDFAQNAVARLSGGAYAPFDAASAAALRELLRAVAVYAAGGRQALARLPGGAAQRIAGQLPAPGR